MRAEVVKLDKSLPLLSEIGCQNGCQGSNAQKPFRAQFCANLSKAKIAVAVGDIVSVSIDATLEVPIIESIEDRRTSLVRDDPVLRSKPQVLAANFDQIVICNVAAEINEKHLFRELAISKNAGVEVILLLTKSDLAKKIPNCEIFSLFDNVYLSSQSSSTKIDFFYKDEKIPAQDIFRIGKTSVLLGKSGVGKSTIINSLAGKIVTETGSVREYDNKGRHTTVAREIFYFGGKCGRIIDMPGLRSLGLIDCEHGIEETFSQIEELSKSCKFRNCQHKTEPGCAVRGNVNAITLDAWRELTAENEGHKNLHRRWR